MLRKMLHARRLMRVEQFPKLTPTGGPAATRCPASSSLRHRRTHHVAPCSMSIAADELRQPSWRQRPCDAAPTEHGFSSSHKTDVAAKLLAMAMVTLTCAMPCPSALAEPPGPQNAAAAAALPGGQEAAPREPSASTQVPVQVQVPVKISLKGDIGSAELQQLGPSPTLFLTARPANYKVPFASRKVVVLETALASFPISILLGAPDDLLLPSDQYPQLTQILDHQDILVSARLDRDGDPNTRDAQDLVGRGVAAWDSIRGGRAQATVVLEGRGMFGKFITTRQP